MKVSIGYTVGSSLSIFLILCISMNAHLVNGQIASIANATFAEDLSLLHVVVCFSNDRPTAGVVAIMTNLAVLEVNGQQGNTSNFLLSDMEVCQSHPISIIMLSQNIGDLLTITLASVAAVDVGNSIYSLQIPGPTLSFESLTYPVLEGDIDDNTIVMMKVCQTPITFSSSANVIISGGSAVAGQDYIQPTGSITIQEQTSCTTLQIDIISDILAEETETIIVQLQPVLPSRLSATSGTTTVTIFDDDNLMTTSTCKHCTGAVWLSSWHCHQFHNNPKL